MNRSCREPVWAGTLIVALIGLISPLLPSDVSVLHGLSTTESDRSSALAASPSLPRLVWHVEQPGWPSADLGPLGKDQVALFFSNQPRTFQRTQVRVVAATLLTGAETWRTQPPMPDIQDAAADANGLYLFAGGAVSARAWKSGTQLWTVPANFPPGNRLLTQDGMVFWTPPDGGIVGADGTSGRERWRSSAAQGWMPVAVTMGAVYLWKWQSNLDVDLLVLDAKKGSVLRQGRFAANQPDIYTLPRLYFSSAYQLLFGEELVVGPGVEIHNIRVTKIDLSPVWQRSNTGRCEFAADALVCEAWYRLSTGPYGRAGLVALDPATGTVRWQRADPSDANDEIVGAWNGAAVIVRPQSTNPPVGGMLAAVRPRDGGAVWSLAVPVAEAGAYGPLVVMVLEQQGQPARVQAYQAR